MNSNLIPDEIIVVNDGGDDSLEKMLESLDIKTKLVYAKINEDIEWNYTGARNLGIWLSTGKYLSMEDNDHIPKNDFYEKAVDRLEKDKEVSRVKAKKRMVVKLDDVLNNNIENWEVLSGRPGHEDTAVIRREVALKVKGFDERFAGRYAWASTDWRRRMLRAGIETGFAGCQFVVKDGNSDTFSRRKSGRNYQMARRQKGKQSEKGILNFTYEYSVKGGNG